MYNQPYFIPGYIASSAPSMIPSAMGRAMTRSLGGAMGNAMNGARLATQSAGRGLGLFGRLSNSMKAIKGINWGSLITNTSKTLNVVNQAIPLVRQVGPMVNNMKSMLRVASIFKDETDKIPTIQNIRKNTVNINNLSKDVIEQNKYSNGTTNIREKNNFVSIEYDDNSPTFFINS